ncbi:hypothetical protein EYZ11_000119 [Aspergillus tanneri]|uniref:Uncharacterized protein n=1 Tax=Aspergillus tanneri TaxID=1220188 RepID=A0A4S3JXV8_9EURO|nr:hypothetical protein EYZ11_000119 [Aspergillus tanneri]
MVAMAFKFLHTTLRSTLELERAYVTWGIWDGQNGVVALSAQ